MPRPARRIGTTTGFGLLSNSPFAMATGVLTFTDCVLTSLVASYASNMTISSTKCLNVGESVFSSRSTVNL